MMFGAYAIMSARNSGDIRIAAIIMIAVGVAAIVASRGHCRGGEPPTPVVPTTPWTWLERSLLAVLIVSVAAKGAAGAASIAWNPGRCEDALAYWLFKAKVVTAFGHISLDAGHPFYLGGSNPKYPIYPSMIAAWIPLVVGEWRESLSVIPWLVTFFMMPVAAALALPNDTPRLTRIIAAYLISSLPLSAIHVFRPGYVDLILGSFLMCAVGMMFTWRRTLRVRDLALATLLLIAAACTKREGVIAAAVVLGVFLVGVGLPITAVPWTTRVACLVAAAIGGLVVFRLMDLTDVATDASGFAYHPEAWAAFVRHMFTWSSFSFLFPLAIPALLALPLFRRDAVAWLTLGLSGALLAYAISPFLFTDNVRFALNDQTPSRLLLQIAPSIVIALAYGYGIGPGVNRTGQGRSPLNPLNAQVFDAGNL